MLGFVYFEGYAVDRVWPIKRREPLQYQPDLHSGHCPRVGKKKTEETILVIISKVTTKMYKEVWSSEEWWAIASHEDFVACFSSDSTFNKRLSVRHVEGSSLIENGPPLSGTEAHPGLQVLHQGLKHRCLHKNMKFILIESKWHMMW